jgi:hypothetical protein
MHVGSESVPLPRAELAISTILGVSATRPGAERGTVNRMLPDFRFVLGAILAIALLAVAGLGLVTSVRLVQEARISPIEDARSLAFTGHAQWNQFYDPEGARRFEDLAGKAPATETRLETPADTAEMAPPVAAPAPAAAPPEAPQQASQDETASLSARHPEPVIGAVDARDIADDKPPASDPPPADPAQLPETVAAVSVAAAPAPAVAAAAPELPAPAGAGAPPTERVASAPAMVPESELRQELAIEPAVEPQVEPRPQAQAPAATETAVDPLPTPPTPRARPKPSFRKRIVRAHIRRAAPVSQQTTQNSGFPPSPAWPSYDNQFTGATATKKNAGKLTGTLTNRPQ